MRVDVLYADEHFVAVNKPSGIVVHPGWERCGQSLLSVVRDQVGAYVYPVHRLDRSASGVVLFALSSVAAAALAQALRDADKQYLALVRGITPETGVIDHPLRRLTDGAVQPAVTEYRRLQVFERYSLVTVFPRSGRTHQIRRHFKHISHPLIGDVRYGKGEHNRIFRERFGLHRLALHASSLSLENPFSGHRLLIQAPLPDDLAGLPCFEK